MVALSHVRKEIVVSFRGSGNSMNLVLDFALLMNVRANNSSNIKVHTGFYIATMSLYDQVCMTTMIFKDKNKSFLEPI